jgi:hypothetical protein
MNRTTVKSVALTLAIPLAAIAAAAAITNSAYAETPTIDNTPFVSSRTRAEVRAEITPGLLSAAGGELAFQSGSTPHFSSGMTRAQARAQYLAGRDEVSALSSEDSGSSYIARQTASRTVPMLMAGSNR